MQLLLGLVIIQSKSVAVRGRHVIFISHPETRPLLQHEDDKACTAKSNIACQSESNKQEGEFYVLVQEVDLESLAEERISPTNEVALALQKHQHIGDEAGANRGVHWDIEWNDNGTMLQVGP
ncbi:hypothetical protein F5146DRAFT_1004373 [Armillaria mellea]|nr:hypothetical protein F5146DRAFT_1004373 [Armillaria mellea]